MKLIPAIIALLVSPLLALAGEPSELERAIRELPPQFVADIPIAERGDLLTELRTDDPSNMRLDLENGYLHYFSDNTDIHVTSQLYMRQFKRAEGGFVILTHMPKPFHGVDGDSTPRANQTFVFERRIDKWVDITAAVFPPGIDLTAHFRPRRTSVVVEVAPWVRLVTDQGEPSDDWGWGPRTADLHWDGHAFQQRKPTGKTLSKE
jgi:hypothetical protein